jgi:hypothetical protein
MICGDVVRAEVPGPRRRFGHSSTTQVEHRTVVRVDVVNAQVEHRTVVRVDVVNVRIIAVHAKRNGWRPHRVGNMTRRVGVMVSIGLLEDGLLM